MGRPENRLRLIVAGVGGHGATWARHVVPRSADFSLVAIADPNPIALVAAGDANGLPLAARFADLAEAVRTVPADAVLTSAPPDVHLDHARVAFDAGLHLMTEKPIAGSIDEAKEMVRRAESAGRQLVVSQNYRYNPRAAMLRRLIHDQTVGPFGHGHIDFYIPADFTGSFRESMRHVLLVDMAIHHLDLLRHITGRNIVDVSAVTFRPAWSWYQHHPALRMVLRMDGDAVVSYSGDWSARGRNTGWSGTWRLQCAEGSVHWERDAVWIARSSRGFNDDVTERPIDCPPTGPESFDATLAAFAEAIRTGQPAATGGRDNLQSFGAVVAAVQSAEQGRVVSLAEVLR
jgi:predicted dehydrogenase